MRALRGRVGAICAVLLLAGCSASTTGGHGGAASGASTGAPGTSGSSSPNSGGFSSDVPHFDHIVVVWEAHLAYGQLAHTTQAPYLRSLIASGAQSDNMHALALLGKPNYVAMFSGSTHGVTTDDCPLSLSGPNLATELAAKRLSFVGYSQGLPRVGAQECRVGPYVREHNTWADFANVPRSANQPFTSFPSDYSALPAVAYVVPDLQHDMFNRNIPAADAWVKQNLGGYVRWARTHNSLLIVTWDHTALTASKTNQTPLILNGAHVRPGSVYSTRIDHYSVLRTIEDAFGLTPLGETAARKAITGIWQ
jgi:acid phosphatase